MIRRLRLLLIVVLFGVLGAVAGRVAGELRRQQPSGGMPQLSLDRLNLKPSDVAPGIVVATRMGSPPWSWLHVPPWLAAFAVNFALGAFSDEIRQRFGRPAAEEQTADADASSEPAPEPAPAWPAAAPPEPAAEAPPSTVAGPPTPPSSPGGDGFGAFPQQPQR